MKSVLVIVLIAGIIGYITPFASAADAAAGKAVFAKKCASCHGPNGEGNEKIATLMKVEMRHFDSKEVQSQSDAQLKKDILDGNGKMKPVKDVNDKDADDLVAYLRTLAKK